MLPQSSPVDKRHAADAEAHPREANEAPAEPADYDDGLLPACFPAIMAAYFAALAIAAFTFAASGEALFVVAISFVYGTMAFGIPLVLARVRGGRDVRWRRNTPERTGERVDTFGGMMRRSEAVLQIVIVPVGVAVTFAAFSIIWLSVQP